MYDLYHLLLFIHVVAVIVWIGAGFTLIVINARLAASRDAAGLQAISTQSKFFGSRVFSTASLVTLAAGVWMVIEHPTIEFSDLWISWGFTGIVLSIVFGAVLSERTSKALAAEVEANGPTSAAVPALQARLMRYGVIDLLILLSVVWAMVFQPG